MTHILHHTGAAWGTRHIPPSTHRSRPSSTRIVLPVPPVKVDPLHHWLRCGVDPLRVVHVGSLTQSLIALLLCCVRQDGRGGGFGTAAAVSVGGVGVLALGQLRTNADMPLDRVSRPLPLAGPDFLRCRCRRQ